MFVCEDVRLEIGFEVARDRLAKLDRWFLTASNDAYAKGITGVVRVGPGGTAAGLSKVVEVRFQNLAGRDDDAGLALRWEVRGLGGRLFPVLDADLTLTSAETNATVLALAGVYRPPLGSLGAELDRLVLHRLAEATIRDFLQRVAAALASTPVSAA